MTTPKENSKYPKDRAKAGAKAKTKEHAIHLGFKTFVWKCSHHGETTFSTAGKGQCRRCINDSKRAQRLRTTTTV